MKLAITWLLIFNGSQPLPITQADLDLHTMHLVVDGVDMGRVNAVFAGSVITAGSETIFTGGFQ